MLLYSISKFIESPYRSDLAVKICFFLSLIINAGTWFVLYYKIYPFSYLTEYGQIYLHYNIYFGIDSIGSWYNAFSLPVIGLLIIIFNLFLGYFFFLKDKLISYTLVISQTLIQLVLLASAVFIILLNI